MTTRSPQFWILTFVLVISVTLLVRHFVFVPIQVIVHSEPEVLYADPTATLSVTVRQINRLGFQTPFRRARMRCAFEEGSTLGVLEYQKDSTVVTIRATGRQGVLALRIVTEASVFPLYFRATVEAPLAAGKRKGTRMTAAQAVPRQPYDVWADTSGLTYPLLVLQGSWHG